MQGQRRIFEQPLSLQRYAWVADNVAEDPTISSVTDLGCGNGHMLIWLKGAPDVEVINFVDADDEMLERELYNYFAPNLVEAMLGRDNSEKSLDIHVYCGDLTQPDERLAADCITMVEVIEHMELEEVDKVVKIVFGHYGPRRVIITTPNSEFNHLLRCEDEPKDGFRHWDHKFEWTREEFKNWADGVCQKYSYEVKFSGVGHLPNSEPYGPCTQIAVFTKLKEATSEENKQEKIVVADENSSDGPRPMRKLQSFHLIGNKCIKPRRTECEKSFEWSTC